MDKGVQRGLTRAEKALRLSPSSPNLSSRAPTTIYGCDYRCHQGNYQSPVYYVSKALLAAETCHLDMVKLALSLVTAFKKLRLYFQAHTIQVLTKFLFKQVFQKHDASGRMLNWAIEHSEFDNIFKTRAAIIGQAKQTLWQSSPNFQK